MASRQPDDIDDIADIPPVERALLAAIAADPDDDEPRLVYADYLAQRDDPRGELIHLQCRHARDPAPELAVRIEELLRLHGRAWLAPLVALRLSARFLFERGFVGTMIGAYPEATRRASRLVTVAPALQDFQLSVDGQLDRSELARPHSTVALVRARRLSIKGRHPGNTRDRRGPIAKLGALAELGFTRLSHLELRTLRVDADELRTLLASPHLAQLTRLTLDLRMPSADIASVLDSLLLPELQQLDLGQTQGTAEHRAWLRHRMPQLEIL